jgi:MHS family proline/betaine transporter-like MFS transporter
LNLQRSAYTIKPGNVPLTVKPGNVLLAVTIGNMLEWYDFAVYAFLATVIAKVMFPAGDSKTSLILSVGTFGVGFLMRPIGALVLGTLADRKGRKFGLLFTFGLMAAATLAIGLIPSFAAIGVVAPLLVVAARFAQGIAAGGEIGGATAMLMEHAPPGRTGYFASWQTASQAGALLIGALVAACAAAALSKEQLVSWGWRLPFLAGAAILPLGIYIRNRVDDPEAFPHQASTEAAAPLTALWRSHRGNVARGFGITIIWTVSTYFFLVYVPLYATTELKINMSTALFSNSLALGFMLCAAPIAGHLSDKVGRYGLMIASASMIILLIIPGFKALIAFPNAGTLAAFQIVAAILVACFAGPAPAAIAELFPVGVRSSGMAIACNFSVTIFGGFAPLIATGLIARTGNPLAPTWYVIVACSLSIIALLHSFRGNGKS